MSETPRGPQRLAPAESLGFVVNRLARLFAAALQRRIAPLGVAPAQFGVLLLLYERDGQTQAELARVFEVEQPTMANTLNRMQRDGLIKRAPDPSDARRALVRLTTKARRLQQPLITEARAVNAAAVEGLSAGELEALRGAAARVTANLRAP
ncbi:MAG TPA: MarR family transcriptional regulator [Egibacteraceae bacterium]|nr:MarR family transcriptional regulator [Egibacteraceae bacterium]